MRKKLFTIALLPLILCSCGKNPENSDTNDEGDKYDAWCNEWSKPGHVYFHYNRGNKTDYDNFCLWIWNDDDDSAGTLWAYNGRKEVSSTLTLEPMSTSWMTNQEVGKSGSGVYKDNYGVIADVDLTQTLFGGKRKSDADKEEVSYEDPYCNELGFLFPKIDSMDGSSHWTSDGGRDQAISDWRVETNWRNVEGGKCQHIFLSSGALDTHTFYAGSGAPVALVNPIDLDTTGSYSSKTQNIPDSYGVSTTSDSFQSLGVGYQIFVPSFRDSDDDGFGDIRGIIDSLDYLDDLGVQCLWLTPIQQSGSYHGYDISDYYAVDKRYGTIDDYKELLDKCHQRGMKVLMDLVLNHTSKSNVWFKKSQWGVNSGIEGTKTDDTGIDWRNVYTWKYATDTFKRKERTWNSSKNAFDFAGTYTDVTVATDAADPAGASWFKDGESNYYYYGKFGSNMPEINYDSPDTRKLVIDMAKYWLGFGLDGFRLDAVKHIYMNDETTKNDTDVIVEDLGTKHVYDDERGQYIYQPYDYSSNLTKNVAWWKHFANEVKKVYPDCFLVGENFDGYGARTAGYYQGLDSQFDFANYYHIPGYLYSSNGTGASQYASEEPDETFNRFSDNNDHSGFPGGKRSNFINGAFTSNHDVMRAINQANCVIDYEHGKVSTVLDSIPSDNITGTVQEVGRAKVHAAISILNPGLSWIYYGDELGMSSNTNKHIEKYGNENSEDIWYRQPMLWADRTVRTGYKANGYKFEYDAHNQKLAQDYPVFYELNETSGKYETKTDNEMYHFYKTLIEIKKQYPKNAKVDFGGSSKDVLVINVKDGETLKMKIFIHVGLNPEGELYGLHDAVATIGKDYDNPSYATFEIADMKQENNNKGIGEDKFSWWYNVLAYKL